VIALLQPAARFNLCGLMKRYLVGTVVGVILAYGGGCRSMPESDTTKIGPGVLATLQAQGAAQVVVALTEPAADPMVDRRAAIARLQRDLLADIESEGFRRRQLFAAAPAIAGTVLSETALQALAAHHLVRRIDLDASGGGTVVR
jgi:hypothetical protein